MRDLAKPQTLDGLRLPVIAVDAARPPITARRTDALLGVIGPSAAPPATDMHYLVTLAHRRGAFGHAHHPAGEMNTTLSPRMTMVPYRLLASPP